MKSDVIVVQFVDRFGRFKSTDIQEYLDGKNQWNQPINEKDIIKIEYSFSNYVVHTRKVLNSAIMLVHRKPSTDSQ